MQEWGSKWLNLAGKLVLIKYILDSYPIFTCAIFLTPSSIVNGISIVIRKFISKGGKTQGKNFNLVNWDKIMEEKTKGGLGIKDPGIMNKAFGAKLVWRFISGEKD